MGPVITIPLSDGILSSKCISTHLEIFPVDLIPHNLILNNYRYTSLHVDIKMELKRIVYRVYVFRWVFLL